MLAKHICIYHYIIFYYLHHLFITFSKRYHAHSLVQSRAWRSMLAHTISCSLFRSSVHYLHYLIILCQPALPRPLVCAVPSPANHICTCHFLFINSFLFHYLHYLFISFSGRYHAHSSVQSHAWRNILAHIITCSLF